MPAPDAILLDIEGTTTPIAFVHEVLFPYARARLGAFVHEAGNAATVERIRAALAAERAGRPEAPEPMIEHLEWLMDRDVKSPALKELQGLIWDQGYRRGDLRGEIYPDVAPAIGRWHAAGRKVAIYSSGSVLAQKLLFSSTRDGDLTSSIDAFFDTGVGPKTARGSYARIAASMDLAPGRLLFVSDVTAELDAAQQAGVQVRLSIRPGNVQQPGADGFEQLTSFDELL